MKQCSMCDKPLYPRNKSGFCAPCRMSSANRSGDWSVKQQLARLATLASQSASSRLAKFQVRHGDDECWGWAGCDNGIGYGKLRIHGEYLLATHVALECDGRPQPSPDLAACHSCDNPPCTNPRHLWWGTEKENMQDASEKGRLTGNRTSNGNRSWGHHTERTAHV